jgi:hypothetical protein
MKKNITLLVLLLVTAVSVDKLQAQTVSACIHDAFGYYWNLTVTVTGTSYSGKGTVTNVSPWAWKGKVKGTSLSKTKLTATNPQADGCASGYTDNFVYKGNAVAGLYYGSQFLYDGSGNWTSYCSGSAYNSGTWSGSDCYHNPSPVSKISTDGPGVSAAHVIK